MTFWLGTHLPKWLGHTDVPLFISAIRLRFGKRWPRAAGKWALDSGGFSELSGGGTWSVGPRQFVDEVRMWSETIGPPEWVAVQDWMCEPIIRDGGWVKRGKRERYIPGTGLGVREHQWLTTLNYLDLRGMAPEIPWVPVIQGFDPDEYAGHVELYSQCGVDLRALPLVGLGSVCRRQGMADAAVIVRMLALEFGLSLHGFGFKIQGLVGRHKLARLLTSADSMAWSSRGENAWRHEARKMTLGCEHPKGCGNCQAWALAWRESLVNRIGEACRNYQKTLW